MTQLERALHKPFYSPAEVADLAGVSSSTILNYIRADRLTAVRLSERLYRIPRNAVLRLLEPDSVRPVERINEPDVTVDPTRADEDVEPVVPA